MGNPLHIAVGTGQEIKPENVLGEPIKVVILGDTYNEIAVFSQDADYIVHKAIMEDSLKSKAILLPPSMAAKFAIKNSV